MLFVREVVRDYEGGAPRAVNLAPYNIYMEDWAFNHGDVPSIAPLLGSLQYHFLKFAAFSLSMGSLSSDFVCYVSSQPYV